MSIGPTVTIVTPAYNQGQYLTETIESVLAQDYPHIEYIVLDDGSTDDTPQVLERYAHRLRAIRHPNMGQARTLNAGWALASGHYLGYLSSDDVLYPSAVSSLVRVLQTDPGIACAFPDCDLIDSESRIVKRQVCQPFDLERLVVEQECHIGPGALFTRAGYAQVGGWRPELRLAPDREFWMRLASQGRFEFVRQSLAGYRLHPKSISYRDVAEEISREYIAVLDDYFSRPGAPAGILARKAEAYGRATLVVARNAFRSGRLARGLALYREACTLHPELGGLATRLTLARNVVSKPLRAAAATLRRLGPS
jgi:glycosyltransferase involved in cell wall biosynthesis